MTTKSKQTAQNPLILNCHRLMEAFAKSDDERDFFLDRLEGFIVYVDLDKSEDELSQLDQELIKHMDRYCPIPKLTFYETKKIMEGFVNEKVYDIDTKEKLLDIIQSKEAREHFLEFLYDHHSELEKWQQYYQERSRIRIIEWLRTNHFYFVFEEDLDLGPVMIEKLKRQLFQTNVPKDVQNARKALVSKAKTYYSSEALNPRPKRGRPPKQVAKAEVELKVAVDVYTTVPLSVRPFLFKPEITSASGTIFSSKFESEEKMLTLRRSAQPVVPTSTVLESLQQKLASLRQLSSNWQVAQEVKPINGTDFDEEEVKVEEEAIPIKEPPKTVKALKKPIKAPVKKAPIKTVAPKKKAVPAKKPAVKKPAPPPPKKNNKVPSKPIKKAPVKKKVRGKSR